LGQTKIKDPEKKKEKSPRGKTFFVGEGKKKKGPLTS